MKRRDYERLLDELVANVDTLLPGGVNRQCIVATKIAIEVVRQAGGRARALPVKVLAYSPEFRRRLDAGLDPADGDTFEWRQAGAIGVAIGYGDTPHYERSDALDPWDGHLVALVGERYLLDLTIGQVTLRSPLIPARPFWLEVPRAFLRGGCAATLVNDEDGTKFVYTNDRGNDAYLRGAAWCDHYVQFDGRQVKVHDRRPDRLVRRG